MILLLCTIAAFIWLAIDHVRTDLNARPVDVEAPPGVNRTIWKYNMLFVVGTTWFLKPVFTAGFNTENRVRAVAFGLLTSFMQLLVMTVFIWGSIRIPLHFLNSIMLRIGASTLLVAVGWPIFVPLLGIITMPISMILSIPLDLLFPRKATPPPTTQEIEDAALRRAEVAKLHDEKPAEFICRFCGVRSLNWKIEAVARDVETSATLGFSHGLEDRLITDLCCDKLREQFRKRFHEVTSQNIKRMFGGSGEGELP